jgi:hypothetical protein
MARTSRFLADGWAYMLTNIEWRTKEPTMQSNPCLTTISLARPLHARVLDRIGELIYEWSDAWDKRAAKRRHERDMEAVADMNELLLRDIGAPDWLIAQANARREIERQRMLELSNGRRDQYL